MTTGTESPLSDSAPTVVAVGGPRPATTSGPVLSASAPVKKGVGLGTQFFVAAALLVLVLLGVAIGAATVRANAIAEKSIREALAHVPDIFRNYWGNLDARNRQTLHSIADEPGTKALLAPDVTYLTVLDWSKEKAKTLRARTVFVFDSAGVLVARSDVEEQSRKDFSKTQWVADALTMQEVSATIREGKVLAAVSSAPVLSGNMAVGEGRLVGVVAASFPLDEGRAQELKGITGGQVAFLANTARRGEPAKVEVASATPGFGDAAFLAALDGHREAIDALFKVKEGKEIGPLDLVVEGDRRIVGAVPIKHHSGETLGAFVVSRSRAEETAAFRQIRNTLFAIGLVALLISIPVSFAMGRRIARPLEQLSDGAVAIRDGNLDVKLPESGSGEVGALARAFRAMVGELKEKRELEQMVAEMQRRPQPAASKTMGTASTLDITPVAAPGAGPQIGRIFGGRYKVLSILGKGGMGSVYLATDRELEEDIALKVLTPDAFEEGTIAVQTLKQEIRLARKITHPNVVRTHDLGETDGVRFLTMEYVPGTMLKEVVERKGRIALAPGLQIAKQLCRGLGAVHEAGIIHRDIKPHNIMVLPNGVVKLMDFGIARSTDTADNAPEGQTVGTPYYMSPEQARGEKLDARSDLYSVGVVLYELFTGQRPIEGKDPLDVMRKHISIEPKRPRELRPDMPELLERIILACLAKEPARRPPGANELYGALQRVAA
jgi:serine/threonine-protein kinase